MVEKWFTCLACHWVPKTKDEQSTICPKCGNECVQKDYLDENDMEAYRQERRNRSDS